MKAWKTVDAEHADLVARGALLIGTLADHVALETPALASAARITRRCAGPFGAVRPFDAPS